MDSSGEMVATSMRNTDGLAVVEPCFVVGIGASAGGLESLEKLFRNLPTDTGMAFVVLQHLSPDFKSMMLELLGRDTSMTIHRVEDGMRVAANCVYLLPPKKEMIISGGTLHLRDKDRDHGLALPIDTFLGSLATEYGAQSVAIILSGSGSDGSRGVVEIARNGGFVISEALESAKFDGMPSSAIATGVVDEVLPPEAMGELIARITQEPRITRKQRMAAVELRQESLRGLDAIYQLFRRVHEIDFSVYKDTTVLRRIHRRAGMIGDASLDQYAERLAKDAQELNSLYCDLLIGVTQFFRDAETFSLLGQRFLPEAIARLEEGQPFRVWVSGCATGEEPYSIAITIHELFEKQGRPPKLKLFATDVHKSSIEHAGRGIYTADVLKGISPERLEKYFVRRDNDYQVSPEIRRSIVYAPHNVLNDAPFTDLDMVSCRNLLIYFQPAAQTRALSMFHYGLKKDGIMLLGGSESPGELAGEFDVLHERARIYRKLRDIRLPADFRAPIDRFLGTELHTLPVRTNHSSQRNLSEQQTLHDQLLNRFMPPSLLIDENRALVDCFGGAEKFLKLRPRRPSLDVLDLMDESLRTTLSGAIGRTLKDNLPVRFSNVALRVEGIQQTFNLTVTPFSNYSISGKFQVISFEALGVLASDSTVNAEEFPGELDASRDHIRQLEIDLRYSRENLQATIEELETSNEELQATNEELIASNEELQSTNEELHSVNEELYTVNAEHQRKNIELAELYQDMNLLLENTDVATIFLDRELRVRRFTSRVRHVFDFVEHDVGRYIRSFSPKFVIDDLVQRLEHVVRTGEPQECETLSHDGTHYLLRMVPYRIDDTVEGAVLMLVDVSSLEVLRERLRWMSAIVESTDDAIIGQNLQSLITTWNIGAEKLFGYAADEAIGQPITIIIPPARRSEVAEYHATIAAGQRMHTRDTIRQCKDGREIHVSLTISPVLDGNNQLIGISKIARDVSERIAMEEEIRRQVKQREAFLATLSHELRNPLGAALNASRVIQDDRADESMRQQAARIVDRQITMTRTLLSDLLDISRITHGKIELRCETVDLCRLIDLVRETTLSEATSHLQQITWNLPPNPVYVHGDATRLVQVQVNLVHNALKYSPQHTDVAVTIAQEGDQATVTVVDYGVGIPPDQLENIFDPFVQIGETVGQSEGGLGVGLTLVRSLVHAHGGTVTAESQGRGTGTTVRVVLPAVEAAVSQTARDMIDSHNARPLTIVLIEDIDDSRMMLTSLLTLDGHIVHACCDGESGVDTIFRNSPEVALVDIGLPGIDGYEVARRVRMKSPSSSLFLVALTGFGQLTDLQKAQAVGFDSHLVKPIDLDQLNEILASIPDRSGAN